MYRTAAAVGPGRSPCSTSGRFPAGGAEPSRKSSRTHSSAVLSWWIGYEIASPARRARFRLRSTLLHQHQLRNWVGRLTPDGKTLVSLSTRDNGTTHLFKTALARHTEDPDDLLVKARRNREDAEEAEPEDELHGFDRELKAAVDEALRMLAEGKWRFTTEDNQGSRR